MLDLNGDGVQTLQPPAACSSTSPATGQAAQVGWASAQDGLLVRDINGDGVINDGRELFGAATVLAAGNGPVTATEPWPTWTATPTASSAPLTTSLASSSCGSTPDSDGITDAGELKGLVDFGVVEINLDFAKGTELNNGNLLGMTSSYTGADGSQHAMADVWFAKQAAPELGDLLAAPAADVLGSLGTPGPVVATVAAGGATAMVPIGLSQRLGADDDLLRSQPPLV
jgi:hypothetical protein